MHRLRMELAGPPYGLSAQPTVDYGQPLVCLRDFETIAELPVTEGRRIFVSCATHCRLMDDVVARMRRHVLPETMVVTHLKSLRARRVMRSFVSACTLVTETPLEEMAFLTGRGIPAMAVVSGVRESLVEAADDTLYVQIPEQVAMFPQWPDALLDEMRSLNLRIVAPATGQDHQPMTGGIK